MSLFSKYQKTDFDGGGCMIEEIPLGADIVTTAPRFMAPRKIDYRDMLVSSSNQGQTPHCVGYSTAGCCEFWHWKKEHYPKQFNGDAIYAEAKKLDGSPDVNGTWTKYGVKAAMNLGYITGKSKYVNKGVDNIKFALHEYSPFVAGFIITTDWNIVNKKNGLIKNTPNAQKSGGHAVLCVGYDDVGLYLQNSWGEKWGIYGFGILGWEQVKSQFMNGMVIIP